ncbi:hypothetical protein OG292_10580 [Streptomyces sp. NBC_01511]|uniref:hypothetical protein n=1 Tax=Streptomyces sp. NBC_01511 TaxID=2903889 RepID=UPI00386D2693
MELRVCRAYRSKISTVSETPGCEGSGDMAGAVLDGYGNGVGRTPESTSREALTLLDDIEEVLGEKVLKYAVRQG